ASRVGNGQSLRGVVECRLRIVLQDPLRDTSERVVLSGYPVLRRSRIWIAPFVISPNRIVLNLNSRIEVLRRIGDGFLIGPSKPVLIRCLTLCMGAVDGRGQSDGMNCVV